MKRVNVAFGYMRAHIAQYVTAIENEIKKVKRENREENDKHLFTADIHTNEYIHIHRP